MVKLIVTFIPETGALNVEHPVNEPLAYWLIEKARQAVQAHFAAQTRVESAPAQALRRLVEGDGR